LLRAVEVMNQTGIKADTKKTEDEENITYTIVIPKRAVQQPHLKRDQTAAKRSAF
jgi:hypothetical protein